MRLHYTWLPALVLLTAALAVDFSGSYPLWQSAVLALATSLFFLASMVARETGRIFLSRSLGISARSVIVYVFGGSPPITQEKIRPVPDLVLAVSGVMASLVLAAVFLGIQSILGSMDEFTLAEIAQWQVYFNVVIALFNVVPGFPLDGGRGLRAILWMIMDDYSRATRIAVLVGRGVGFICIFGGILMIILGGGVFTGLGMAIIGWFLENAAAVSLRQAMLRQALRGVTARYMMTDDYTPIKQELTLEVVRDYVINSGQRYFLSVEDGELKGMVTLHDIKKVPKKRWGTTRISQIISPPAKLATAQSGQAAVDVLELMEEYDVDQIPVLEGDKLVGVVVRDDLVRFLSSRAMLGA